MKEDASRLYRELKADVEIIATRCGLMGRALETVGAHTDAAADAAQQASEAATQAAEAAKQAAEAAKQAAAAAKEAAEHAKQGAREVADLGRWMEGRLRLTNERFDRFLGALDASQARLTERVDDIDERVTRLEKNEPPAA